MAPFAGVDSAPRRPSRSIGEPEVYRQPSLPPTADRGRLVGVITSGWSVSVKAERNRVLPHFWCRWSRTKALILLRKKEVRGRFLACCRFETGAVREAGKARYLKAL